MIRLLFLLFLCVLSTHANELVTRTQVLMGTYVSISLPQEHMDVVPLAFARLKEVEMALSSYDPHAEIYRLNHDKEYFISSDTYEALSLCAHYYKKTKGYFDITIGSITKGVFHFGGEEVVPNVADLLDATVSFKGLHFYDQGAWLDEGIVLDLGGMGKGFGVDKAIEVLKEQGVKEGIVSLSGDIRCLHKCQMAIQHPFHEGLLASFTMAQENTGISTSGNYRRYVKDKKYNHLINPKTHRSQKTFASITLISEVLSNSDLDAYSTAASVMPRAEAFTFLNALPAVGYLIVTNDKKLYKNRLFDVLTQGLKLLPLVGPLKREYIRVHP